MHTPTQTKDYQVYARFHPKSTRQADMLANALEKHDIRVHKELFDGHKHIDLALPQAKINIEVDGIHHFTDPDQIVADLNREYYSAKKGYATLHIPNEIINNHLDDLAMALAEAAHQRAEKLHLRIY